MIKAFLFDFNDTLIRSPAWMRLEIHTFPQEALALLTDRGAIPPLAAGDISKTEKAFLSLRRANSSQGRETAHVDALRMMVNALGLKEQISDDWIEETVAELQRRCLPDVTLIEGVPETLQNLKDQGYRLSIISNAAYAPFLYWTLTRFGLAASFEQVFVSADLGVRKPNIEIFRLALEELRLAPEETVYTGDDFIKDVDAAKRMGMRAIWFNPEGKSPPPGNFEQKPDTQVIKFRQISDWGLRWRGIT